MIAFFSVIKIHVCSLNELDMNCQNRVEIIEYVKARQQGGEEEEENIVEDLLKKTARRHQHFSCSQSGCFLHNRSLSKQIFSAQQKLLSSLHFHRELSSLNSLEKSRRKKATSNKNTKPDTLQSSSFRCGKWIADVQIYISWAKRKTAENMRKKEWREWQIQVIFRRSLDYVTLTNHFSNLFHQYNTWCFYFSSSLRRRSLV